MYNMISFDTLYVSKKLHMEAKIMKKAVFLSIAIIIMTCCFFVLVSCNEEPIITDYTISYHDANGLQSITVQKGSSYSIDYIPIKAGHVFLGWYNQETGGTQYVSATGACVSVFNDSQNLMLFPQFAPKTYTLVLDYQGAEVTGSRSFEVVYNEVLPNLPTNPTKEHMVFKGWYTAPNGGGTQIADKYGVIPTKDKLTESTFNLSNNDVVTLYAAFELEKYNVTLYFDSNEPEEINVEYGTWITDITYETRVNNQAVLTWSKTKNDTTLSNVFSGKITQDVILYATEYAPVITFDTNDGDEISPIIARVGTNITLPNATKDLYEFNGWQLNGVDYNATIMPNESITLTAKWQAKLVFDENGGTSVSDISLPNGEAIILPTSDREGYVFAGWYNHNQIFDSTIMPSESVSLIARWYQIKTDTIVIKKDSTSSSDWSKSSDFTTPGICGPRADWRFEVDLSKYIPQTGGDLSINIHYDMDHSNGYSIDWYGGFYLYDGPIVSDAYFLTKKVDLVYGRDKAYGTPTWDTYTLDVDLTLTQSTLYMCLYAEKLGGGSLDGSTRLYFKNIYAEIEYADTSVLY